MMAAGSSECGIMLIHKELDVLLLDEPDAHLHPTLQGHLIHKLSQLA